MHEESFQDEILFDRLVDGELSEAEQRRLLASLDDRPDGWRRCALAFLESQSWSRELGEVVRQPSPSVREPASPADDAGRRLRHGMAWLAVAASVVVAFTIGSIRSGAHRSTAALAPPANEQAASVAPSRGDAAAEHAPVSDAITLWVRDETGRKRPLRVPLVEAGELDRELGLAFQSAVPAGLRERLRERGYDVQSRGRYAPLWLENGRRMIVPVEDTKIVPVSQPVY